MTQSQLQSQPPVEAADQDREPLDPDDRAALNHNASLSRKQFAAAAGKIRKALLTSPAA